MLRFLLRPVKAGCRMKNVVRPKFNQNFFAQFPDTTFHSAASTTSVITGTPPPGSSVATSEDLPNLVIFFGSLLARDQNNRHPNGLMEPDKAGPDVVRRSIAVTPNEHVSFAIYRDAPSSEAETLPVLDTQELPSSPAERKIPASKWKKTANRRLEEPKHYSRAPGLQSRDRNCFRFHSAGYEIRACSGASSSSSNSSEAVSWKTRNMHVACFLTTEGGGGKKKDPKCKKKGSQPSPQPRHSPIN